MRPETQRALDQEWSQLLGVAPDELWQTVTVRAHSDLEDYPGWYVAWRGAGLHVSAPTGATAAEVASLEGETLASIASGDFWAAFAAQRGLELRGPATYSYLDDDPGPDPGVTDLSPDAVEPIRALVAAHEWADWHADRPVHTVGVVEGDRVVAAASLDVWHGLPRNIGVIVAPDRRGHGLAARVGRSCASYAVREHGLAIWRAATTNIASVRTAERLGFEPFCTQLAARPAAPTSR